MWRLAGGDGRLTAGLALVGALYAVAAQRLEALSLAAVLMLAAALVLQCHASKRA